MDTTPSRTVTVVLPAWPLAAVVVGVLAFAVVVVVLVLTGAAASAQEPEASEPPPSLVILARSDNPADALASGPVGGVLGAPVLVTPSAQLHPVTAEALQSIDPDLVVLAGGTAALSDAVEQAVADLGYVTRRAAGSDRHETAVLVSALLAEWVTPHQRIAALEGRVADLEATLAGVTRTSVDGHDTLQFEAMNVQVTNGTGTTDGDPNGLGNLIVGYNTQRPAPLDPAERTGSHYLVVGDEHEWTRFGGILAGVRNTATGAAASVTGGTFNTASGPWASVSGGANNTASGWWASVSGGVDNTASSDWASVTGGSHNTASGTRASVSGGIANTASGDWSSILGGVNQTLLFSDTCHPSC